MAKIFVVEDDEAINRLLCMNLEIVGYEVLGEQDGRRARERAEGEEVFDLVLLDIMLPGEDGFSLLECFRAKGMPVIFLTAKNQVEDKVRGLRGGAEDYMVKPFAMEELLVRMEKVLSRREELPEEVRLGDVLLRVQERLVLRAGEEIRLSALEFDLLWELAKHKNMAMSREKLLEAVWGTSFLGESRVIDAHVSRLRIKTGLTITAVPRVGYRLEV